MEHSSLACGLLSNSQLTRLASRGGRNRSSTRLPVWGVNYEKGACTSPLFHFCTLGPIHSATPSDSERSKRPEGLILAASPHIDCVQRNRLHPGHQALPVFLNGVSATEK